MVLRLGESTTFRTPIVLPTITLGKQKFASIGEQLRKRKDLPTVFRLASSPFLTGALVGTLGLITGTLPIVGALGVAGGIPTVAGVVKASPKIEALIKEKILEPEEFGARIGEFLEDPITPIVDLGGEIIQDVKEKVKETVKDVKKKTKDVKKKVKDIPIVNLGLGAVGLGAGAVIIPKIIESFKGAGAIPDVIGQTPAIQTSAFVPLSPVQQPKPTPPAIVEKKQKPLTIKNTFNPTIDISFKKNKKFINQQINIR